MKSKLLLTLFMLSVLILAGCSGASLSLNPAPTASSATNQPTPLATEAPATTAVPAVLAQSGALAAYQNTFEQIYQQVNPSVVNVNVVEGSSGSSSQFPQFPGNPFGFGNPGSQTPQMALGSGFVWDTEGHIVTNNHVIAGANKITVTFSDGTSADATLVGADPNSDLAVLKVNVPASQLHPVSLADSSQVKVGELAIAIGNPYGLSGTMTAGIVSGLSRSLPVGLDNPNAQGGPTYAIPDIIQTDASINPGNSGGVLVNDQGQLIGVTAAIASPVQANSGIGFVIPSAIVQKVVPSLITTGKYEHPWLGITGTTLTPDLAQAMSLPASQQGVLVVDVTANGPAAEAGVQGGNQQATVNGQQTPLGGDVIVAVDGHPVNRFEDLLSYLFNNTKPGQTVSLTVLRQGKEQALNVTLGVLPNQP